MDESDETEPMVPSSSSAATEKRSFPVGDNASGTASASAHRLQEGNGRNCYSQPLHIITVLLSFCCGYMVCLWGARMIPTGDDGLPAVLHSKNESADADSAGPTSTDMERNHETSSAKPILYIHVGPQKTGTSYLQSVLSTPACSELLEQDNIVYIGTTLDGKQRDHCLIHNSRSFFPYNSYPQFGDLIIDEAKAKEPPKLSQLFQDLLHRTLRDSNRTMNALIVYEYFWTFNNEQQLAFANAVKDDWDVQLIVGYRAFYDYILSWYDQWYKCSDVNPNCMLWPHEVVQPPKNERRLAVYPFDVYNRSTFTTLFFEELIVNQTILPQRSLQMYEKWFPEKSSVVIDMTNLDNSTNGNPLLVELLCHAIPSARNSCAAAQQGILGQKGMSNPSVSLDADIFQTLAYEKQLFAFQSNNSTTDIPTRRDVVHKIQSFMDSSHTEYPRACVSNQTYHTLLDYGAAAESKFWSSKWAPPSPAREWRDDVFRQDFSDFAREHYCFVDFDKVLDREDWRNFLQSI